MSKLTSRAALQSSTEGWEKTQKKIKRMHRQDAQGAKVGGDCGQRSVGEKNSATKSPIAATKPHAKREGYFADAAAIEVIPFRETL